MSIARDSTGSIGIRILGADLGSPSFVAVWAQGLLFVKTEDSKDLHLSLVDVFLEFPGSARERQ